MTEPRRGRRGRLGRPALAWLLGLAARASRTPRRRRRHPGALGATTDCCCCRRHWGPTVKPRPPSAPATARLLDGRAAERARRKAEERGALIYSSACWLSPLSF